MCAAFGVLSPSNHEGVFFRVFVVLIRGTAVRVSVDGAVAASDIVVISVSISVALFLHPPPPMKVSLMHAFAAFAAFALILITYFACTSFHYMMTQG